MSGGFITSTQSFQGHVRNKSSKGSYLFSGSSKMIGSYMNETTYPYVNEDDSVLTALSLIMDHNIFAIGVIRKNT